MMISEPMSSTPRYRSPSATVRANVWRKTSSSRATSIPAARPISGDTSASTSLLFRARTKSTTAAAATMPNAISPGVSLPGPPKSASRSSSPELIRLPVASAAEKTTPMIVSVAILVRRSSAQTASAPKKSIAAAPNNGWMPRARATPMPGRATWESASAASAIRRMITKEPTRPAATAIAIDSAILVSSVLVELMDVVLHRRAIQLVHERRRQDAPGRA